MMANVVYRGLVWIFLERRIQGKSYPEYRQLFGESSSFIQSLIDRAEDNAKSRWELLHIIGMERWIQTRLKVAVGEPFIREEYDGYRPPEDTPWGDLKQTFVEVREASCDLCAEFEAQNVDASQKIEHNQFGEISVKGWMEHVLSHSTRHAKQMTLRS